VTAPWCDSPAPPVAARDPRRNARNAGDPRSCHRELKDLRRGRSRSPALLTCCRRSPQAAPTALPAPDGAPDDVGMTNITTTIQRRRNLAATHELLKAVHHPRLLTHLVRSGEIIRVRQGWYCLPTVPSTMQEAVRVGGRLSCISGCEFH